MARNETLYFLQVIELIIGELIIYIVFQEPNARKCPCCAHCRGKAMPGRGLWENIPTLRLH
jgi:hypothetical protein